MGKFKVGDIVKIRKSFKRMDTMSRKAIGVHTCKMLEGQETVITEISSAGNYHIEIDKNGFFWPEIAFKRVYRKLQLTSDDGAFTTHRALFNTPYMPKNLKKYSDHYVYGATPPIGKTLKLLGAAPSIHSQVRVVLLQDPKTKQVYLYDKQAIEEDAIWI